MGGVYKRGNRLWLWYLDQDGKRQWAKTGLPVGDEKKAKKALAIIEAQVRAAVQTGLPIRQHTVDEYRRHWVHARKERGVASALDDDARLRHAMAVIGKVRMSEIRPLHIRDLFRELRTRVGPGKDQLAPRTVRHVYGVLHRMFADAVSEERIDTNPCVLPRGELPPKADKDPEWRSGAVFSRAEIEMLISDPRVPEDCRMFYGLAFLGGMRTGEVSALRLSRYDAVIQPLGKLLVAASFNTRSKKEKGLKTGGAREVPVHPALAKMLAEWRLSGFARFMGRQPRPDDLIVPRPDGRHRDAHYVLYRFSEQCLELGLRRRRQYDSRRTFISLAQADGARSDILKWVTHGRPGDIVSLYTTLPWAALCAEVAKLKVSVLQGQLIALPKVVGLRDSEATICDSSCDNQDESEATTMSYDMSPTGFEADAQGRSSPVEGRKPPLAEAHELLAQIEPDATADHPVTLSQPERERVARELRATAYEALKYGGAFALIKRLQGVIRLLSEVGQ